MDSKTVSVIIPVHTMDRWTLIQAAVSSVLAQTHRPVEIMVAVDDNPELLARCRQEWSTSTRPVPVVILDSQGGDEGALALHVRVHGSRRRFGAGMARNVAADVASGDVLAFLDDDAAAEPDWLERLLSAYVDDSVVAVGGAPLPSFETGRPSWFPGEFDWVFGCAYVGLPEERSVLGHLIGANMSVRRSALTAVGGFHSVDFDDLDLCMRLAARYSTSALVYEPLAVVRHFVPAGRVSWKYFWRRCYFINREKVLAFNAMGPAANLDAERAFVVGQAKRRISVLLDDVRHLRLGGLGQFGASFIGMAAAGGGNVAGRIRYGFVGRGVAPG